MVVPQAADGQFGGGGCAPVSQDHNGDFRGEVDGAILGVPGTFHFPVPVFHGGHQQVLGEEIAEDKDAGLHLSAGVAPEIQDQAVDTLVLQFQNGLSELNGGGGHKGVDAQESGFGALDDVDIVDAGIFDALAHQCQLPGLLFLLVLGAPDGDSDLRIRGAPQLSHNLFQLLSPQGFPVNGENLVPGHQAAGGGGGVPDDGGDGKDPLLEMHLDADASEGVPLLRHELLVVLGRHELAEGVQGGHHPLDGGLEEPVDLRVLPIQIVGADLLKDL